MVVWFKRSPEYTFWDWLDRCLGSGISPGPLWARVVRRCISEPRRWIYRYHKWCFRHFPQRPINPRHLAYAAGARCRCGAGMAYHKGCGVGGSWFCGAWLTMGPEVILLDEHDQYSFMSYDIKSEGQASASGRTTRPGVEKVICGAWGPVFVMSKDRG